MPITLPDAQSLFLANSKFHQSLTSSKELRLAQLTPLLPHFLRGEAGLSMAAQFSGKKQEFWLIIKSSFSESCFLIDKTGIWWHLAQGNILFSHLNFLSSHNIREQWVSGPLHGATNLRVSYEANSRGPAPLARLWQTKNRGKIWIWKGPQ